MKKYFYSFIFAFTFLTAFRSFNLHKINFEESHFQGSVVFFPLIGIFFGCVYYFTSFLYISFGFHIDIVSLLIVGETFLLNNFLHFDGYCDVCDAFLANKDKSRRLEILKDPNIGSFALGSAILMILLKFILIKIFLQSNLDVCLFIVIPVYTRFSFVFLSFISKYPRKTGTGAFLIGKIKPFHFLLSLSVFLIIILLFLLITFKTVFILIISMFFMVSVLLNLLIRLIAQNKIGGITGDILGFSNEILFLSLLSVPLILIYFGIYF